MTDINTSGGESDERAAFEAFAKSRPGYGTAGKSPDFANGAVREAWEVWQARAAVEMMVDISPPATSRDRWMYRQGRLAERAALATQPAAPAEVVGETSLSDLLIERQRAELCDSVTIAGSAWRQFLDDLIVARQRFTAPKHLCCYSDCAEPVSEPGFCVRHEPEPEPAQAPAATEAPIAGDPRHARTCPARRSAGVCDCWPVPTRAAAVGASPEPNHALKVAIDALGILARRPRPLCRDCADEDGTCPSSGLPCDLVATIRNARNALAAVGASVQPVPEGLTAPFPPIKGAWIDGGYVIVTPAGTGNAPALKAAILAAALATTSSAAGEVKP